MRPGAYLNFESVPAPTSMVGSRGIVTMPVAMCWGASDTLIPLYSTDLLGGASLEKVGCTAFDEESLVYREALSNAYLALVYRIDAGGTKATASEGGLSITAKYPGTAGDKITVSILKNKVDTDKFDVVTYFDGAEKDRQTVTKEGAGLAANDWVEFEVEDDTELTAISGIALGGGENGTVNPTSYAGYFSKAAGAIWNTMAIPDESASVKTQVVEFIKNRRESTGRKCQAVVVDYADADYEGIISVSQGYINAADEKVTPALFAATVAGMTAGAAVNQSNTFRVINGAQEIINPIADEDIEAALQQGKFVLSRRQDGAIVVEQDINSLHSFSPTKDYSFSKNRVVRVLDDIGSQILHKFESAYIGKIDNNAQGRGVFRADIISYINELQGMGAVQNFDPATDIKVEQGMAVDSVVAELWVQPVDAMEKLYMQVYVGGNA